MLSISRAKSAKSGMQYFEADSYYAKKNEQGEWYGLNTQSLGLEGGIERGEFRRILDGCDLEGNALVRHAMSGKRRSYVDFTFSCPKSVSVLSYVDKRIEAAHNAAVSRALQEIERNYAITREGAQGHNSYKTGNILAARFNHHESRELEPQLHSHCVIMNMTMGKDGKWRSLEMGEMYRNQLYIGQVYRNELAKEMAKIGYKIDVSDRSKGLFEIAGVKHEIIDEFSTRRKQVIEAKKKYEEYNLSDAKKAEMACLDSRKYKYDTDVEKIRADTQERLKEYGTTLETLKQEALDATKSKTDSVKVSKTECIRMALEDITESQSAFKKEDILAMALKNGLGQYTAEEMIESFKEYKGLLKLGEKDVFIGRTVAPDIEYFTTREMMEVEGGIIRMAERLNGKNALSVDTEKLQEIIKQREDSGVQYSEGQKQAIEMMCTSKSFINIVQGDAGAGKTFAVETFREIMNDSGYTVRGFAPTAKAAVELQSAKIETSTVDSFLLSKKEGISKGEIWVVDESGMMGSRKLSRFLQQAEEFKAKVILIGDSKQFQAVEQGKMFSDLQKHPSTGYAEITEVRRQKTDYMKEIVAEFKKRSPDGVEKAFRKLNQEKKVLHIENRDQRLAAVARDYLDDRAKGLDTIVLTATNRDRTDLNQSIRSILVEKAVVDKGNAFNTLQNAGLSGSKRRFADNYRIGQQVFFQKESGPIKRGSQAEITGFDPQKNSLTLQIKPSKPTDKPIEHTIDLFKEATKIQAFNVVQKNFGVGDRVITLKNDKLLGVENGKIGTIKYIDDQGNAHVTFARKELQNKEAVFKQDLKKDYHTVTLNADFGQIPSGTECHIYDKNTKEKTISVQYIDENGKLNQAKIMSKDLNHLSIFHETKANFNLVTGYSYLDHAYAVTSYKSQGATVDQVRWCHDHSQQTNYNEAYVAITRARLDAVVYTSDPEKLIEHASKEQEKESVIQWQKLSKEAPQPEAQPTVETKLEPPVQPAQEKRKEATYGLEI